MNLPVSRWMWPMILALVFLAVPLAFLGVELTTLHQSTMDEVRDREMANLTARLKGLKREIYPQAEFFTFLYKGCEEVLRSSTPGKVLRELREEIRRDLGVPMEFLVFNSEGRMVKAVSDIEVPEELEKTMCADFDALQMGFPQPFSRRLPEYQKFLGPLAYILQDPLSTRALCKVQFREQRRYLFVSKRYAAGRILVFVDETVAWKTAFQKLRLKKIVLEHPGWRGAVLGGNEDPEVFRGTMGDSWNSFLQATRTMGRSLPQSSIQNGWYWVQVPLSRQARLIVGAPDQGEKKQKKFQQQIWSALGAIFLGAMFFSHRWALASKVGQLRLGFRLYLLLGYVVGLPLLVCWISARELEHDLQESLVLRWQDLQEVHLKELDHRVSDYLGSVESRLKERYLVPAGVKAAEPFLIGQVQKIIKELPPLYICLLDERGKTLIEWCSQETAFPKGLQKVIQSTVATKRQSSSAEAPRENVQDTLLAATTESYGFNTDFLVALVSDVPGHFLDMAFLNANWQSIINLVPDQQGDPRFVVFAVWEKETLDKRYMLDLLPGFQAVEEQVTYFARGVGFLTGDVPAKSSMGEAAHRQWAAGKYDRFQAFRAEVGSESWLISGMRGKAVKAYQLYAGSPPGVMFAPLERFRTRTMVLGILLVGAGLLMARQLSLGFLSPIRELASGVKALQQRDFAYRIPDIGSDELGRLGQAFNGMLEGMKDLELARVLQENIYPKGPAELGNGWTVFGTCRSAGQVGGDFFDYFPVCDGRWALIMGDVSGHGVSAALVVAIAKGLFTHPGNEVDPLKVLNAVQTVFFQVLYPRRMMMTCFFSLFDPKTGNLEFGNAGHNYPYVVNSAEATIEALALRGLPLGIRKNKFENRGQRVLKSNDLMVAYTDGFIEALDRKGEQIGYKPFEEKLLSLAAGDVRHVERSLRSWQESIAAPGPQADDISLLILKCETPSVKGVSLTVVDSASEGNLPVLPA